MKTNNYPSWLVPLEIAEKLRNINFNEKCYFYYDITLQRVLYPVEEENRFEERFRFVKDWNGSFKDCISLPTWEQMFEWFREKGLVGTIEYEDFILDDKTCYYAYRITDKSGDILFYSSNYKTYETYEETREALINKLIELYERK
jgi:hypothetical protein